MQAWARIRRQGLRYVDAQCYDGKADAETDASSILERIAEMIESVAVVEKRGDAEVMGQIADDFHGAGNQGLAAIADRPDLVRALAGGGNDGRTPPADRVDR